MLTPRPRGGDWLEDEIPALKTAGVTALVSMLTQPEQMELGLIDESQIATAAGIAAISWPVEDYGVPESVAGSLAAIDALLDRLRCGAVVAIHCRQSIGRGPLAAASILVRHGLSADDAWARVQVARGVPVPDRPEQRAWVERVTARR